MHYAYHDWVTWHPMLTYYLQFVPMWRIKTVLYVHWEPGSESSDKHFKRYALPLIGILLK